VHKKGGQLAKRPTPEFELGDTATAALVRSAIDRFSSWKFEAGERLLKRALVERRKQPRPPYLQYAVEPTPDLRIAHVSS